jgi:hypothetical protein
MDFLCDSILVPDTVNKVAAIGIGKGTDILQEFRLVLVVRCWQSSLEIQRAGLWATFNTKLLEEGLIERVKSSEQHSKSSG